MKDKIIKVADNSMVYFDDKVLGIDGENLQGKIIFYFENFKNGVAWLEFEKEDGTKKYIPMNKVNETYEVEIKPSLLSDTSIIYLQLRITEDENENGIPVFKSNKFYMNILSSINATSTIEEDYPDILDVLNNKLEINDIVAGDNIKIEKEDKKITISSTSGGGEVTKKYVDDQDTKTLENAKEYADNQVPNVVETYIKGHKEELKGEKGEKGIDGRDGTNGKDGYTPQKGVDYWTDEDKQEFVKDLVVGSNIIVKNGVIMAKEKIWKKIRTITVPSDDVKGQTIDGVTYKFSGENGIKSVAFSTTEEGQALKDYNVTGAIIKLTPTTGININQGFICVNTSGISAAAKNAADYFTNIKNTTASRWFEISHNPINVTAITNNPGQYRYPWQYTHRQIETIAFGGFEAASVLGEGTKLEFWAYGYFDEEESV